MPQAGEASRVGWNSSPKDQLLDGLCEKTFRNSRVMRGTWKVLPNPLKPNAFLNEGYFRVQYIS